MQGKLHRMFAEYKKIYFKMLSDFILTLAGGACIMNNCLASGLH